MKGGKYSVWPRIFLTASYVIQLVSNSYYSNVKQQCEITWCQQCDSTDWALSRDRRHQYKLIWKPQIQFDIAMKTSHFHSGLSGSKNQLFITMFQRKTRNMTQTHCTSTNIWNIDMKKQSERNGTLSAGLQGTSKFPIL